MPLIDLRSCGQDALVDILDCDICIIGSGPAGSTIAHELAATRARVTLLESGGLERSALADSLNEIENIGRPREIDQWGMRNRMVGGSSHTWGGRCAPFDEIDFEDRDWIPHATWPLDEHELAPYLDRSAPYLGLAFGKDYTGDNFWALRGKTPPAALPSDKLRPFYWQFSKDGRSDYRFEYMRFGKRLLDDLPSSLHLVAHATVIRIDPVDSGDAVKSVVFAGPDGKHHSLAAGIVVLCGGGIENARMLLNSRSVTSGGLGNQNDLVGRYLMDHPRGPVGTFDIKGSAALQRRFGRYVVNGNLFRAGFRLSPDIQRAEKLINSAAWLGEKADPNDPLDAVKRIASGKAHLGRDLPVIAANIPLLARGTYDYFVRHNGLPRKLAELTLDVMSEQIPDFDSRVTLSDRCDHFGMPLSRIDWRVHPDESRSFRRLAELAAEELPRIGLPAPHLAEWVRDGAEMPLTFLDVGHPIGTTRMANDPKAGVVDRNCEVHDVRGLFVCGTSTVPTAGHANPTQMVVAMALRLSDHLKQRMQARSMTSHSTTAAPVVRDDAVPDNAGVATPHAAKPTVLVTGATGRIGRIVVADLIERGYGVVATTSKRALCDTPAPEGMTYRYADFSGDVDYDALLNGCSAVIHLAAELGNMAVMQRVNVDATRHLAEAAERAAIASFCYVSTVSVYGSGRDRVMTETAPTLSWDHDNPSEYWALEYVRMYGRTKLLGERAIAETAKRGHYVIMRPAVVVDIGDIVGIADWNPVKRLLAAHRNAHHIYVHDVSDALIWAIERGLGGKRVAGAVETYNLSDSKYHAPRHRDFLRRAYAASNNTRYRVANVPGAADWLHDFLRFRTLPLRNPLWRMHFPNDKLLAAGYTLRYGIGYAYERAIESLRTNGTDAH